MIRAFRKRHFGAISLLTVMLPALFAAALWARTPVPEIETWPAALRFEEPPDDAATGPSRAIPAVGATVRIVRSGTTTWLRIAIPDPIAPDPLVYSCAGGATVGDRLPGECTLIGIVASAGGAHLPIPVPPAEGQRLVLYSLAQNQVIGEAAWPRDPEGR